MAQESHWWSFALSLGRSLSDTGHSNNKNTENQTLIACQKEMQNVLELSHRPTGYIAFTTASNLLRVRLGI